MAWRSRTRVLGGIERDLLTIAKGAKSLAINSTSDNHNASCRSCGSLLYSVVRDGAFAHVTYGTLADAPSLRPTAHIYLGSKALWFTITDDLPQHEEIRGSATAREQQHMRTHRSPPCQGLTLPSTSFDRQDPACISKLVDPRPSL